MAKTPDEMAAVGKEFSHQTALFAWAAMARLFGVALANRPESYQQLGFAKRHFMAQQESPTSYPEPPSLFDPVEELKWLHAIKNQGHGDRIRGSRSQAEGVRPGVFDLFLPVPMPVFWRNRAAWGGGLEFGDSVIYCGLYIELKTPDRIGHNNGGASDEQLDFQADMRAAGYAAEICHGWKAARDCLLTYLGKSVAS